MVEIRRAVWLMAMAAAAALVSGCATSVRTQLNTFRATDAEFGSGTIAVRPADETKDGTLEFDFYRSRVEGRLEGLGYRVAEPEEATYIARLGYSVQEARPDIRQPNVYFTTGFGSYYRRGGVGFMMRDYPEYRDEYLRRLTFSITRTPEELGGEPRRIYEVTALSKGSCPILSVVFDEMLAAVFQNFPGENGSVKSVTVRGDARCE